MPTVEGSGACGLNSKFFFLVLQLDHPSIFASTKHVAWCIKHEVFTHRLKKWSRDYNYCTKNQNSWSYVQRVFMSLINYFSMWIESLFLTKAPPFSHTFLYLQEAHCSVCAFSICVGPFFIFLNSCTIWRWQCFTDYVFILWDYEWLELAFVPFCWWTFSLTSTYQTYTGAVRCLHCWM